MIKRSFIASLLLALIAIPLSSLAQTPAVTNGLNWLGSIQTIDGNWPGVATEEFVATATATDALFLLNPASSDYSQGLQWLEGRPESPTDLLARRIIALTRAGHTTTSEVAQLIALRDASGGWGGESGYLYNLLDTALALQALKAANATNLTNINATLATLTTAQNSDGGWGFSSGSASNVNFTAVVSATLQQFPQMTSIATAVNKATVYLLAHQNSDGGFGNSPSTVHETALACNALVGNGQTQDVPLQSAVNYLAATQGDNGSWNDDPYATALALKALYLAENRPAPPPLPPAGGTITGTLVDALTNQRLAGVTVVLASDALNKTTSDAMGNFALRDVPSGSQQVSFTMSGYKSVSASANVVVPSTVDLGSIPLLASYTTGTIAGTIADPAGKPLAGVAITGSGAWSGSVVTGADGDFAIDYVSPGAVTLTASKAGYQNVSVDGTVYARTTLSFSPRMSTTPSQATTGTLTGRVVSDFFGRILPIDHLPDETGVTVTLTGGIAVEPDPNNGGYFTIPNLAPNTYQVTVGMNGFTARTFRVVIPAGSTIDLGTIVLEMSVSTMTLSGVVTDATTGAPLAGAEVMVSGTLLAGRSDFGGSYAIATIPHPAEIMVKANAPGYSGKSFLITTSPFVQKMDIALTPRGTAGPGPGSVEVAVASDKTVYDKRDNVGLAVTLRNVEETAMAGTLLVRVSDPAGAEVYTTNLALTLPADLTITQNLSLLLPLSAPGGSYTARAEFSADNGTLLGSGSKIFAVATSQIVVTPLLPATLTSGGNAISFQLVNSGKLAVSTGDLVVSLRDPEGAVVSTATATFALGLGESKTLPVTLTIPALKFGNYTLSYAQSDETITVPETELSLPNTVAISALFDNNSHRIRQTAGLTVTLTNTGRFSWDNADPGIAVTVATPDAGFAETKRLTLAPAAGSLSGSTLLYQFVIPETMTAGLHGTKISVVLSSGSSVEQVAQLAIFESSLSLAPMVTNHTAGGTLSPVLTNNGGVDTSAGYTLSLLDAKAALIAEQTDAGTVTAGGTLPLGLVIPTGAVEGYYSLVVNYIDLKTGKEQIISNALAISGVKGTLAVQTGKETYLVTENITGLSTTTNTGTPLTEGNLHLQVTAGPGAKKLKTWTTLADFQTGVRSGVDTYGVNDWIIPDDDFEGAAIDANKWSVGGKVSIVSGKAFFDSRVDEANLTSRWKLEGDFDIQVDYSANQSVSTQGPQLLVFGDGYYATVHNNSFSGDSGDIVVDGAQYYNDNRKFKTSGKLRLTRVADRITTYYWDSTTSAWVMIVSAATPRLGTPCSVVMKVWRSQALSTGASAQYDNFKVNTGRLLTVNQTVDSVRLLPLNDNFDDEIFNEDRWRISDLGAKPAENSGSAHLMCTAGGAKWTGSGWWSSHTLVLRSPLTNDFSAVVSYKNLITIPAMTQNGAFVLQANADGTRWLMNQVLYNAPTPAGVITGFSYLNGIYEKGTYVFSYPTNSGRFRLSRQGTRVLSDYWDGTSWITLHSKSGMHTSPATIQHYIYSNENLPTTHVDLDHFYTNKGTYAGNGIITLRHDSSENNTRWGKILYTNSLPTGTSVKLRTRTAETEAGLATAIWSDFLTASGSAVTSPAARWIEIEATLASTNTNVTPLLNDLTVTYETAPGQILWQTDVPANLAQDAISELNSTIGTLGVTGKLYLQGTLTSSTGQTIATAEYPFYVEQGNLQVRLAPDKKIYRPGEIVTISGEVMNLSSVAATGLGLLVKDPTVALFNETFDLPANSSHLFSFTTTAGSDGVYTLNVIVTQNATTLAEITDQYETTSPMVTATLTAPDTAGNDPFTVTVALNNPGKVAAATSVQLTTDAGEVIASPEVILPAGETRMLQYTRQIAAATTYTATFSGDLNQTLTKSVAYAAMPTDTVVNLSVKIATDKIAYNANDMVTLTSTLTASALQENLSALITVTDNQGRGVFSASAGVPLVMPGQTTTIKRYWNAGTNPAGTYLVSLQILNPAGVVVANARCDLAIYSSTAPTALLRGQISLDQQSILTGEAVTVSSSVTNSGNIDLGDMTLSIRTVHANEPTVFGTIANQASLPMGATVTHSGVIDTSGYSAMDYLVVLTANIDGVEETLAGTYFRVEGAPSAPALAAPGNNADVATFTPALSVSNAADPNADRLTYEFEIYAESSLTTMAAAGMVTETTSPTQVFTPPPLTENQTYFWRVRAYDGRLYSPWMEPVAFRVNTIDDPPTAPGISSPADGTAVAVLTPTLSITNASDPDSTELLYNFDLSRIADFSQLVATGSGVASGQETTTWAVPVSLEENGWYYWRAQADDLFNAGPWSDSARFQVNTANDPPSPPVIVAPVEGSVLATLATEVVAANSVDPDSTVLSYLFEADSSATFDSPNLARSAPVVEGQGTTPWHLEGLLDNTRYFIRSKASDGLTESPWSPVVGIFANTVNDPPTTPVLDNPSAGAGVTLLTPTLSVRNATDLDGDALTYAFEVYADAALTTLIAQSDALPESSPATAWTLPGDLTENQIYYWHARASDGSLSSDWMPTAAFMVNVANDAPGAPQLAAPADGATVATLTPLLEVVNALDPDSDILTYDFEVYSNGVLSAAFSGVAEGAGTTSVALENALSDDGTFTWRVRAHDGDRYGAWMNMATFSTHIPRTAITAEIDFAPESLNRHDHGQWVKVEIALPHGYRAADIDLASIRLGGVVPIAGGRSAFMYGKHENELTVRFRRSEVVAVLPVGRQVPVHVTGKVGLTPFAGVDIIKVLDHGDDDHKDDDDRKDDDRKDDDRKDVDRKDDDHKEKREEHGDERN